MSATTENPIAMIQDPGGSRGTLAGSGETVLIQIAKSVDGIISNSEVTLDTHVKPDGIFYIGNCHTITFFVAFIVGSLTSGSLIPQFGGDRTTLSDLLLSDVTAGSGAINIEKRLTYIMTADTTGYLVVPNPGLSYMKMNVISVGTVTSSSLRLDCVRGYSHFAMPTI